LAHQVVSRLHSTPEVSQSECHSRLATLVVDGVRAGKSFIKIVRDGVNLITSYAEHPNVFFADAARAAGYLI